MKKNEDKQEKKTPDILDQVKGIEKMIKVNLLMKSISRLKKMAREINEIKAEGTMMLEEIGISKEDIKRIIDFVGDTPEVQLSDEDKKDLRGKVRRSLKEKREKVKEKIENTPIGGGANMGALGSFNMLDNTSTSPSCSPGYSVTTNNSINEDNLMYLSNDKGSSLQLKI